MRLDDFTGIHGDFETFMHDSSLPEYIVRYWDGENQDAYYAWIVGCTMLPNNEVLLHLVDAEGTDDVETSFNKTGVSFILLSQLIGKHGFMIVPNDNDPDDN